MATQAPSPKTSRYAGRSALTGLQVLKPTSKGASVSVEQVRAVIRQLKKHN